MLRKCKFGGQKYQKTTKPTTKAGFVSMRNPREKNCAGIVVLTLRP